MSHDEFEKAALHSTLGLTYVDTPAPLALRQAHGLKKRDPRVRLRVFSDGRMMLKDRERVVAMQT